MTGVGVRLGVVAHVVIGVVAEEQVLLLFFGFFGEGDAGQGKDEDLK